MYEEIDTIVAKLDTSYLARDVLGMNFSLDALLLTLDCPHQDLHYAGNDANCTLRAFLLLVYYGLRPSISTVTGSLTLGYLKILGMQPLPNNTERNALLRKFKPEFEDVIMKSSGMGNTSFFEDLWGTSP